VNAYCQIEHVESDSDVGTTCCNRAIAECADCRAAAPSKVVRDSRGIEFPNRLEQNVIQLVRTVSNPMAMNFIA
jgi:hypothetical protein